MRLLRRRRPRLKRARSEPFPVRVVLDFGATGARAVLFRLTGSGAEILGLGEVQGRSGMARPGQVMHHRRIADLAERALSAAEWSSRREGALPFVADDAVAGLTGPLLLAHTEVYHVRRADPLSPVFEPEVAEAIGEAQRRALGRLAALLTGAKIRRRVVASQLVGVLSLREDTRRAERMPDSHRGVPGLAGDFLSIALCNITWPSKGLEILSRVLEDLRLDLLDVTPNARAVAASLPVPDAILVDIGREHTEVTLAEGGSMSNLTNLALGGQFFTQFLTRNLRVTERQAETLKRSLHPHAGGPSQGPVTRLLVEAGRRWLLALEQALLGLAGDAPLPARIYLFGGGAALPGLIDQARAHPWTRRLPFDRDPVVELLLPRHLAGAQDPRGLLLAPGQVGVAALAAWAAAERSPLEQRLASVTEAECDRLALG